MGPANNLSCPRLGIVLFNAMFLRATGNQHICIRLIDAPAGEQHFEPSSCTMTAYPYRALAAQIRPRRVGAQPVTLGFYRPPGSYRDIATLAIAMQQELDRDMHLIGLHWRILLMRAIPGEAMTQLRCKVPESRMHRCSWQA